MKSYELQPTIENLINTYKSDAVGRNKQLHYFLDILGMTKECSSIAIDGKWGCGKTFFVKQAKMILDSFNEFSLSYDENVSVKVRDVWNKYHSNPIEKELISQVSIYFDAWQYDNDDDPLLSLVFEMLNSVNNDYSFAKGNDCLNIIASIAECLTGKNISSVIKNLREKDDPFKCLKDKRSLDEYIEEFLISILEEKGERLVVFVDELDRCKPSYAVKLLERIKHYFTNDKITFVFSINTLELQHTIKQYYGINFDACRYLDRFFDMRLSMPPADMKKYYSSIGFDNTHYTYNSIANVVIQKYRFELREISKYLRLIKIAASKPMCRKSGFYDFYFNDGKGIQFCLLAIVPIAMGLRLYDIKKYYDFIDGRDYTPLIDILINQNYSNWLYVFLLRNDETFDKNDASKKLVTMSDKLIETYDALFNVDYTGNVYEKEIGQMSFSNTTRTIFMETMSLLSDYADYND